MVTCSGSSFEKGDERSSSQLYYLPLFIAIIVYCHHYLLPPLEFNPYSFGYTCQWLQGVPAYDKDVVPDKMNICMDSYHQERAVLHSIKWHSNQIVQSFPSPLVIPASSIIEAQ